MRRAAIADLSFEDIVPTGCPEIEIYRVLVHYFRDDTDWIVCDQTTSRVEAEREAQRLRDFNRFHSVLVEPSRLRVAGVVMGSIPVPAKLEFELRQKLSTVGLIKEI